MRSADLYSDVQSVRRMASVLGVRSTSESKRAVAERALEHRNAETRALAAELLEELDRIPVFRRR